MKTFEEFVAEVNKTIDRYNDECHFVGYGAHQVTLKVEFDNNGEGEYRAVIWKKFGKYKDFQRAKDDEVIIYDGVSQATGKYSLWKSGETIKAAKSIYTLLKTIV